MSLPVGVFAGESGFEPIDPRSVALVRVACLLEHLAASPLGVARSRRPCLRELPLAYIRDARALISELVALIGDRLTLIGYPVSFLGAARSLFEGASQPFDAASIRRARFQLTVTFSHS